MHEAVTTRNFFYDSITHARCTAGTSVPSQRAKEISRAVRGSFYIDGPCPEANVAATRVIKSMHERSAWGQ